jgi:hypothetical protein
LEKAIKNAHASVPNGSRFSSPHQPEYPVRAVIRHKGIVEKTGHANNIVTITISSGIPMERNITSLRFL